MYAGEEEQAVRMVYEMEVEGRRPRRRPKRRWDDICRQDIEELGLTVVDVQDREHWRKRIRAAYLGPLG